VQPLTPASTVAEARAHLRATGESVAPVLRHGRPVGLVSAAALHDAERCGSCDAPVSAVMDYLAVPVPRGAGPSATSVSGNAVIERRPHGRH
jgi:CBS domain-containing protein